MSVFISIEVDVVTAVEGLFMLKSSDKSVFKCIFIDGMQQRDPEVQLSNCLSMNQITTYTPSAINLCMDNLQ